MTQIFVQPEPEHITPVTISTNDRADNLSSQIQPDDTLVDTVISSSERSDSVITDFQSSTEEVSKALQELDMSQDSMSRCQGLDSDLRPFIDFLSDGSLPKSQKRARSVLLQVRLCSNQWCIIPLACSQVKEGKIISPVSACTSKISHSDRIKVVS